MTVSAEKTPRAPGDHGWDSGTVMEGSADACRPMLERTRPFAERLADEKGWPSEP